MTDASVRISKPVSLREDALAIVKRLRERGHVAYFAGGCVRDMLLGIDAKDYDVATDAAPARVREIFSNTQAVGAAFGVILVRHGKSQVEVATFRSDASYEDGRRPTVVHFTSPEEDAKRRDFTINGLFYDPIDEHVIDFVGGQEDLNQRVLRAIGEAEHRFAEDHLRLLRAVRFAARFTLSIEPGTAQAIHHHAQHLKRISPERIAEELRMMLTPATRVKAYRMLREFGLVKVILRFFPEVEESANVFEAIADPVIPFGLALAAMVLDVSGGKFLSDAEIRKATAALRQALKISNEESDQFHGSLAFAKLMNDTALTVAKLKRFLAASYSREARTLMDAVGRAGIQYGRIELVKARLAELEKTDVAPVPLLTGDDLMAAGYRPGPVYKKILDAVYDAQLEEWISSKEEGLKMAEEISKSC